jgi:hypothetical protein
MIQGKGDLKSILELQKEDPKALALLIALQSPEDGLKSLREVSQQRKLNPDELFAELLREFYQNPTAWSASDREKMLKRLERIAPKASLDFKNAALILKSRLQFND